MTRCRIRGWMARALVLGACMIVSACNDEVLLEKLDQHQANQTLAALQRRNIAAQKISRGKNGYDIVVGADDFTAALDTLNTQDLPPRARVEVSQAFPSDAMVSSPSAERARLLSLVEQRLEQTLATIDTVDRASVHISYPLDDASVAANQPIHIAALVVHERGVDEQELIAKLKRFMRNAVDNVNYDDISITLFETPRRQLVPPAKAGSIPIDMQNWMSIALGTLAGLGLASVIVILVIRPIVRALRGKHEAPAEPPIAPPERQRVNPT